jgi:hypothetical protein
MAAMFIKVEAANGRTIEQVEDEVEATYSDLPLTITPATLGGQPAIMVVGEPGRSDSRKIYVVNSDRLYTVTVTPYEDFAETRSYADAILQLTLDTFWFIGN